jgi:hypothetical protein
MGSISLGWSFARDCILVPNPAAGIMALVICRGVFKVKKVGLAVRFSAFGGIIWF